MEITISVRQLVEFMMRSGNIDNRHSQAPENAMLEGGRIHRMIQSEMGPYYRAEVSLKYRHSTPMYDLIIEGRADGIEELPDADVPASDSIVHATIVGVFVNVPLVKEYV